MEWSDSAVQKIRLETFDCGVLINLFLLMHIFKKMLITFFVVKSKAEHIELCGILVIQFLLGQSSGIFQNISVEKGAKRKSKKPVGFESTLLGRNGFKIWMRFPITTLSVFGVCLFLGTMFQQSVATKRVTIFALATGLGLSHDHPCDLCLSNWSRHDIE